MTTESLFVSKPKRVQQLEHELGKPIQAILADLFEELGSREAVALHLGISYPTLQDWTQRFDVRLRRSLSPTP